MARLPLPHPSGATSLLSSSCCQVVVNLLGPIWLPIWFQSYTGSSFHREVQKVVSLHSAWSPACMLCSPKDRILDLTALAAPHGTPEHHTVLDGAQVA
jgi:hypothetical protein